MNLLCLFSGQGYQHDDLFTFFHGDTDAQFYLNQFTQLMKFDCKQPQAITKPQYSQLIISAYQLTLFHSIKPLLDFHSLTLAGYSLGEVSAFLASAQASAQQINEIISFRTQLMTFILQESNAKSYDLISIYSTHSLAEIELLCRRYHCYVAIINAEQRVVVGGLLDNLHKLVDNLTPCPLQKIEYLSIQLPSHTPYYQNKSGQFQKKLQNSCATSMLKYPIISPLKLSKVYVMEDEIELLDKELYSTLRWDKVCSLIKEYQYDLIIDLGPGKAMGRFLDLDNQAEQFLSAADYKSSLGFKNALMRI